MVCDQLDLAPMHALRALPPDEAARFEAHVARCPHCRQELAALQPVVAAFSAWPTDVLRPAAPLWDRVAVRISGETARATSVRSKVRVEWEEVAPSSAA